MPIPSPACIPIKLSHPPLSYVENELIRELYTTIHSLIHLTHSLVQPPKQITQTLTIWDIDEMELARQLTLPLFDLYSKIRVSLSHMSVILPLLM